VVAGTNRFVQMTVRTGGGAAVALQARVYQPLGAAPPQLADYFVMMAVGTAPSAATVAPAASAAAPAVAPRPAVAPVTQAAPSATSPMAPFKRMTPFTCSTPAAPVPGGLKCMSAVSDDAHAAASFAVARLNELKAVPNGPVSLVQVTKAATQVVAGMNYMLELKILNSAGKMSTVQVTVFQQLPAYGGKQELTAYVPL
jgi:hypothetical protein